MNSIFVFGLLLCVAVCQGAPEPPKPTYPTKWDDINLDEILKSQRLFSAYLKCLLDGVGCTSQGKQLREMLPDAIATSCAKCSQKQREGAIRVIKVLEHDHKADWEKLLNKWDPQRKNMEAFKKAYPDIFAKVFTH